MDELQKQYPKNVFFRGCIFSRNANLDVLFRFPEIWRENLLKKKPTARKHFRLRAYFFPLWEIQCVNADAVGKNRWEKSGTFISKTPQSEKLPWPIWLLVKDVADVQRIRTRVQQGRVRKIEEGADERSVSVTKRDYIINENGVLPRRRTNFAKCDVREKRDATKFRRAWSWFRNLWLAAI